MRDLIYKLVSAGIEESEAKQEIAILQKEFKDQNKVQEVVNERIKTRKPIQYLIGKAYFMDFVVSVNEKVLIPRPETEILVEETVKLCRDMPWHVSTVIDIGTGSGIIPIALARLVPDIKIYAIDLEKGVIDLATENAKNCGAYQKIHFKVCDLFSYDMDEFFKSVHFDLVISNPPYVKPHEMKKLRPEVYLYEPKVALSGSKENVTGLVYYQRILMLAKKYDVSLVALEIDPPLVSGLKSLLIKEGLNKFEIIKDYAKLDRCLFVYLNP